MNTTPLLTVDQLTVCFRQDDGNELVAVRDLSFSQQAGEVLAIVGESGSGKSVTALTLMGLLQPEVSRIKSGRIVFDGQSLLDASATDHRRLCGKRMAMIFQDPMSALNPVYTIGQQIGESLQLYGDTHLPIAERIIDLLDEVGMDDPKRIAASYPHQMSGGQQQRAMIAMALSGKPQLIIADEPTTALDVTIQKQVLELMLRLQAAHQMAVIFITHDLALVGDFAQRVLVMRHGVLRETGNVKTIFDAPQDAYTRALLACRPPLDGRPDRLPVVNELLGEPIDVSPPTEAPQVSVATTDNAPFLEVSALNTWLGRRRWLSPEAPKHVLQDVSFVVNKGETFGIVGESGSGKTTVGLSIMRLYAASGSVKLGGQEVLSLDKRALMPFRRRVQMIFQNPLSSLNPRFTIGEILLEPMRTHDLIRDKAAQKREALSLLDQVGIPSSAWNRYPHEFSGGQCQRIAIARCLVLKPELLICDESVSALDVSIQAQILNLLKSLQTRYGLTYLFISHDLGVVRYLSHRIMVLKHGRVVEINDADTLFASPQNDYTRQLLAAIPGKRGH